MHRQAPARCFPIVLALAILAACGAGAGAGAAEWTLKEGAAIPGELVEFDFGEKRAVFRDPGGQLHPVPAEELSPDSRWRLLASPAFARSFPSDRWTREQGTFLFFATIGPVGCLLVSFYLCALILFKDGSLLRALAGWVGSALLGGFLMGFYLYLSARSPASATGILLLGGVISTVFLSVYISAVYRSTMAAGLKILFLHLFGAFFFLLILALAGRKFVQVFDCEDFIKTQIMIPAGVLPNE